MANIVRPATLSLDFFRGSLLNYGTLQNPVITPTNITFKRGVQGHEAVFNGTSSCISIANDPSLNFAAVPFTYEFYLKIPSSIPAIQNISSKGFNGIQVYFTTANELGIDKNNVVVWVRTSISAYLGKLVHIVLGWDGTNKFIYINSVVAVNSAQSTNLIESTTSAYELGRAFSSYFKENMLLHRIYPYALTHLEIQSRYIDCLALTMIAPPIRGFISSRPIDLSRFKGTGAGQGLVAAYNMVPTGRTLTDISGNGNTGTLVGSVVNTLDGLQLNGVNGTIPIPLSLSGTHSYSFRFKPNLTPNVNGQLFEGQVESSPGLDFIGGSTWRFYLHTTGGYKINDLILTAGKTYTINIVYDNAAQTIKSYVNGVLGNTTVSVLWDSVITTLYIGSRGGTSLFQNGELQDFRIHNRILSLQETKDYHNSFARTTYINERFLVDSIGSHPMNWTRGSGQYSVQELSADVVSGNLRMPKGTKYAQCDSAGTISLPSNQSSGVWRFKWKKGADANNPLVYFTNGGRLPFPDASGSYAVALNSGEAFAMYVTSGESTSALMTSASSYIQNSVWYETEIRRTPAGQFTVLIRGGAFLPTAGYGIWTLVSTVNGSGQNPVTDATYNSSSYFVLDLDASDCFADLYLSPYIPV